MRPAEVTPAVDAGAIVLDLRPPGPFAAGHLPGAINVQFNRADLADRVELILPREQALVVHGEPDVIGSTAEILLRQAGFNVLGHLEGGVTAWQAAGGSIAVLPLVGVDELHEDVEAYLVLDVRESFEFRHGHIAGAVLLPSGEAWERAGTIESQKPVAVICGDQTRSAAVASMLLRHGKDARLVMGGMVDWLERGYPVSKQQVPA